MQSSNPFIKASYELIMEGESKTKTYLDDKVEEYVVLLFAANFQKANIGEEAIAIQLLEAAQRKGTDQYKPIADECLLIYSYPYNTRRWPSKTYYMEMGTVAYGLANIPAMEKHFAPASRVLNAVFNHFSPEILLTQIK